MSDSRSLSRLLNSVYRLGGLSSFNSLRNSLFITFKLLKLKTSELKILEKNESCKRLIFVEMTQFLLLQLFELDTSFWDCIILLDFSFKI